MDRREAIRFLAASAASAFVRPACAAPTAPIERAIASTGERIPAIGMGTWITFDVAGDARAGAARNLILSDFFAAGGRLVDSSLSTGTQISPVMGIENSPPGFRPRPLLRSGRDRLLASP
jgi:hypothetical protein